MEVQGGPRAGGLLLVVLGVAEALLVVVLGVAEVPVE
jgi:hypothetical protein